ncbi:MAG: hypothetical protein QXX08_00725 [Candidatus Bathyarchaeia archaeon]
MSAKKTVKEGSKFSVPLVLTTRFFQLVFERKFAEAERMFERITVKMRRNGNNEFNSGYLLALKGIILSNRQSSDSNSFLTNLNFDDVEALKKYYKEFLKNAENRLHADYDRGYFSALSEYTRVILKMVQDKNKNRFRASWKSNRDEK